MTTTIYEKIDIALREIRRIQDLIRRGLARPKEKEEAFRLVREATGFFTNEIFKRKAEKLGRVTVLSMQSKDGFVPAREAGHFDDWIALFEEYSNARKIKTELASDKMHIQSVVDGEDQHIFITEKGSNEHTHLILDSGTGEIRIDQKDKLPHDLIKSVEARLELKTGETVQVTRTALSFVESEAPQPDVKAYPSTKDGYFVGEIYNNGDEDLEDFRVTASWLQPPPEGAQERALERFHDATDYLVTMPSHSLSMLKQGVKVYVTGVPNTTVDKKVKITISCKGMKSRKEIQRVFEFETPNQYK